MWRYQTIWLIFVYLRSVQCQVPKLNPYNPEITLKVGDSLKMVCPITVTGDEESQDKESNLMYEWKIKQHTDVWVTTNAKYSFTDNSKVLQITNPVTVEDSGKYVCKGVTGFGSKEAIFNVKVIDTSQKRLCAPKKINEPNIDPPCFVDPKMFSGELVVKHEVGSYAEFSCHATGTPPLKYLWFTGKTIANWIQTVNGIRSPTMSISNLKTTYTGRYTCQVSNAAGSLNYTYRLIVSESPNNTPKILTDLMNYTFQFGAKASVRIEVECECKDPIIKWLKRVDNMEKDQVKGLSLPNAQPSEKGEYYITLESGVSTQKIHSNIIETHLSIDPITAQNEGKYIVMAINKITNLNNFEYRVVYISVDSDKKKMEIKNNLVVYIAVPMVILISSLAVIIYCCFRRHSSAYNHSSSGSRSSQRCGNGSALPSVTNGSNAGSEKLKSPSTTSTAVQQNYSQYKYMYPPKVPSSNYDQYSVLSVSHSSQSTPQYFQSHNAVAGVPYTGGNVYQHSNGYIPVPMNQYPA